MFSTAFDKISNYLDKRFTLNSVFPCTAFLGGLFSLLIVHWGWRKILDLLSNLSTEEQVFYSVLLVVILILGSAFLAIQTGNLIRIFEGYWGEHGLGKRLSKSGSQHQYTRWKKYDKNDDFDFEYLYYHYPYTEEPDDLLPTQFGNALKAAETYSSDPGRYGMDGVFFWSRLYEILPSQMRDDLDAAQSSMEFMVTVSVLGWFFAFVSALYLGFNLSLNLIAWIVFVGGGASIGSISYNSAVETAVNYGVTVRSAFDLYRLDLLDKLGMTMPASRQEEVSIWQNLGQQLYRRFAENEELLKYNNTNGRQKS